MNNNQHFLNFETFNQFFNTVNFPTLNIVSVNIRSISAIDKFNKFKMMISKFSKLPCIIAVQETWFRADLAQIYKIPGYNAVHSCRSDSYGGTSIYIQNNIHYNVEESKSKDFINAVTISLEDYKFNGKPLKFTSFYRSQKCGFEKCLNFIEKLLETYGRFPNIVVGDSNVDVLQISSSCDLIDVLSSFNYRNCHTLITRPESGTSIDNVYTNLTESIFIDTIFKVP